MNVILKTPHRQLFEVQPQQAHSRLSLRRVVYAKLLRWIDKEPPRRIFRTLLRAGTLLTISLACMAPSFMLGLLTSAATWNGYRIPIICGIFVGLLNATRIPTAFRRLGRSRQTSTGNQHTWQGVPVPELCDYLLKHRAFTTQAIADLGLSQKQWRRMAGILEQTNILKRGENNAHVLRDITREQLAQQLDDGGKFPLVWSEPSQEWVLRDGPWRMWLKDEERREQDRQVQVQRLEKKKRKLQRDIREITTPEFTRRLVGV